MKLVSFDSLYFGTDFFICVGLFIYFTGNFFYLLFSTFESNQNVKLQMQLIYSSVTILKNLILGFSFFLSKNNTNNNNSIPFPEDLNLDAITPNNLIK